MTVCQCRPQNVTVLSTVHQTVAVAGGRRRKPETVTFYDMTKNDVKVLDKMARSLS